MGDITKPVAGLARPVRVFILPFLFTLFSTAMAQDLDFIPAANTDISAITDAARNISAVAGGCIEAECPVLDCPTAAALLQALLNAESHLDHMLGWLIEANDDALAHLQQLTADGLLTGEQLSMAQEAQAVHEWLHNIGSLMLDLASIMSFINDFKQGKMDEDSFLEKLDSTYETLKDLESAVDTIGGAYGVETPMYVSDATGQAIGAAGGDAVADVLGAPNATPENIGSAVNDIKSQIGDGIDVIEDAKNGDINVEAIGNMIGRIVKTVSAKKIAERQQLIDDFTGNIGAGAAASAEATEFLRRVGQRRFAVEDALAAVRAARADLMSCLIKACGAASLQRPVIPVNFSAWGEALHYFNGQLALLSAALSTPLDVRDQCPVPGAPGGTPLPPLPPPPPPEDGDGTRPPTAVDPVKSACAACQSIADRLTNTLNEIAFWRAELERIRENLRQAQNLRNQRRVLEESNGKVQERIFELGEAIREAVALGINVAPRLRTNLREAEAEARALQRQIDRMSRQINRLETDKDAVPEIGQRIRQLTDQRRSLRADLTECELSQCSEECEQTQCGEPTEAEQDWTAFADMLVGYEDGDDTGPDTNEETPPDRWSPDTERPAESVLRFLDEVLVIGTPGGAVDIERQAKPPPESVLNYLDQDQPPPEEDDQEEQKEEDDGTPPAGPTGCVEPLEFPARPALPRLELISTACSTCTEIAGEYNSSLSRAYDRSDRYFAYRVEARRLHRTIESVCSSIRDFEFRGEPVPVSLRLQLQQDMPKLDMAIRDAMTAWQAINTALEALNAKKAELAACEQQYCGTVFQEPGSGGRVSSPEPVTIIPLPDLEPWELDIDDLSTDCPACQEQIRSYNILAASLRSKNRQRNQWIQQLNAIKAEIAGLATRVSSETTTNRINALQSEGRLVADAIARFSTDIYLGQQGLDLWAGAVSTCENQCATVELIDSKNISGNDPFDPRDPVAPEASQIGIVSTGPSVVIPPHHRLVEV